MLKKFKLIILLIGVFLFIYIPNVVLAADDNEMKIYSINLGEGIDGDSTLIESNGEYLLMDLGSRNAYPNVNQFLKKLEVTHFSLYLSHFHEDHTGGLTYNDPDAPLYKLMQDYKIDHIYIPDSSLLKCRGETVDKDEEAYYKRIKEYYEDSAKQTENYDDIVTYLKYGSKSGDGTSSKFSFGSVNVSIIGPVGIENLTPPLKEGTTEINLENVDTIALGHYLNNCSLVAKMVCGNKSFLTAGDLEDEEENELIKVYKNTGDLKANVYKMSHHGAHPSNTADFMSYVKPDFTFVSNHAKTGIGDTGTYWRIHSSQANCNKYGFVYMCGHEAQTLEVDILNDNISLYNFGDTTKLNAKGWTKVVGGDGTERQEDYFYFGDDGYTLKGVQCINGKYYYLGSGGYRHYGHGKGNNYVGITICEEDGERRYFVESDGSMYVGFHTIKDSAYDGFYYFNNDGSLKRSTNGNWEKVKIGNYYYSIYASGRLSTNIFKQYDGGMCYFDGNGKMLTGWQTIDGNKYYLNTKTGVRYTGLKKIGDYYYFFSDAGKMQKDGFRNINGGYCYFGNDGKMTTGWKTINGYKYYFNQKTGVRYTGLKKIGNYYYIFSDAGKMQKNSFKNLNGGYCYFDNDGKMVRGWKSISGKKYYFNLKNGTRYLGLQKIDEKYYFFNNAGVLQCNTTKLIDGVKYKFNSKGTMINAPKAKKTSIKSLKAKKNKITVKWKKKSVDGYIIYISTGKNGKYKLVANIKKGNTTSKTIKKLKNKIKYYIKIKTYKKVGTYIEYSNFSKVKSIKTAK